MGIPLIVGICVNLDAVSLMAVVIVLKYSFLLLTVITAVKESVCIVILSLVSLAFSSANRMAVFLASSTDAQSFSLMIISSFLCTTAEFLFSYFTLYLSTLLLPSNINYMVIKKLPHILTIMHVMGI